MAEAINEMERRLAESNPHAGPNAKTEDFNQQPPSVKPAGKRHRTSPAPRKTDEDTKTAAETPSQQAEETGRLKPEGRSASFRNPHGRSWPMRHSPSYCKPSDYSSWSSYPCWQGKPHWRSSACSPDRIRRLAACDLRLDSHGNRSSNHRTWLRCGGRPSPERR